MKKWFFLMMLSFSALSATPKEVMLIRHAEKPEEGNELNQKGRERAAALAPFFMGRPEVAPPQAIFAVPTKNDYSSFRTLETVTPLSQALHIKPNQQFTVDDIKGLTTDILTNPAYEGKVVLVAWEHHRIPEIAQGLGIQNPPKWHGRDFDRVWIVRFAPTVTFQDLPQQLMYGDSKY